MAKNKAVQGEADGFIKRTFNSVKAWVVGNGVEGFLGLIFGLSLWPLGFKIYAGFAFGIFASRNWDLLKIWVKSLLK